jgi:hypothetical protein
MSISQQLATQSVRSNIDFSSIPNSLKKLHRWVIWRIGEVKPDGKMSKIPYYPSGRIRQGVTGSIDDLARLGSFDMVQAAFLLDDTVAGVGLAMIDGDQIVGFDADGCVKDGVIDQEVHSIIKDTYWEISPSGRGVRAFFTGEYGKEMGDFSCSKAGNLEIYTDRRFLTVMGNKQLPGFLGIEPHAINGTRLSLNRLFASKGGSIKLPEWLSPSKPKQESSGTDIDWVTVESALGSCNPNCDYFEWRNIGMALQVYGAEQGDENRARKLFGDWSALGELGVKYQGEAYIDYQWKSYHSDRKDGITIGTLLKYAKDYGWKRPIPNVSDLFKDVKVVDPVDIECSFSPPPPEVNLSIFPTSLQNRVRGVSQRVGCDPLIPLFAGLSALSAAANSNTRIQLDHDGEWTEPPIVWTMVVGESSDKKSPGSKAMFNALSNLEKEDYPKYQAAKAQWESTEAFNNAAKKDLLQRASRGEMQPNDASPIRPETKEPKPLRLITHDATSQKLVRMTADSGRGLMLFLDETNSWFDGLGNSKGTENRGAIMACYDGKTYTLDRVGNGKGDSDVRSDCAAANICALTQPKVVKENAAMLAKDGFFQRFIIGTVNPNHTCITDPTAPAHGAGWDRLIRNVFDIPAMTLTLSPEAQTLFREFEVYNMKVTKAFAAYGKPAIVTSSFGKYTGLVGRVASLLHLATIGEMGPFAYSLNVVSADTMQSAISFVKEYVSAANLYFSNVMIETNSLEVWTAKRIVQLSGQVETVTLSELKRGAHRIMDKIDKYSGENMIIGQMDRLEKDGWVRLIDENKRGMVWAINESVAQQFSEYRKRILESKEMEREIVIKKSRTATNFLFP